MSSGSESDGTAGRTGSGDDSGTTKDSETEDDDDCKPPAKKTDKTSDDDSEDDASDDDSLSDISCKVCRARLIGKRSAAKRKRPRRVGIQEHRKKSKLTKMDLQVELRRGAQNMKETKSKLVSERTKKETAEYALKLTEEVLTAAKTTLEVFVVGPISVSSALYAQSRTALLEDHANPDAGVHTDPSHFLAQHFRAPGLPKQPDLMWEELERRYQVALTAVRAAGHTMEGAPLTRMIIREFKQY